MFISMTAFQQQQSPASYASCLITRNDSYQVEANR